MAFRGEQGKDRSATTVDPRSIRAQGLRPSFVEAFESKGIHKLYEWQASAVQAAGRAGKSFVYSAPTSGGKSLVADILMLNALQRSITSWHKPCKKALVLVPYLSIAAERCEYLADLCRRSNLRVKGYASSESGCPFSDPRENIAVCSYEKGNSALNRLVAKGMAADLCCVVIDEFHMLVDPGRGAALEVLMSKLRYFAAHTQLLCISATMRGLDGVRAWLSAELFQTDFRPVKLQEHVVLGEVVFWVQGKPFVPGQGADSMAAPGQLVYAPDISQVSAFPHGIIETFKDADLHVIRSLSLPEVSTTRQAVRQVQIGDRVALQLAMEGMQQSKGGCLVFCKSRKGCESGATEMSKMIHQATISEDDRAARMSVAMNLLADQSARAHQPLEALLLAATGVAYHHAELSACERRTVEKAFRSGVIHTLFCTTTLAAGINLPASMCIIRCHNDRQTLKRSDYVQMIGRAGRAGYSATGQSYLVCDYHIPLQDAAKAHAVANNQGSARTALRIIQAEVAELKSNLVPKGWDKFSAQEQLNWRGEGLDAMKKLVLEVMMLRSLTTRDVFSLMHVTLAAYETRPGHGASAPDDAIAAEPQQSGNDQQMQSLYHCGLAALRALNREALVNNFDEDERTCDAADREFPATGLGRAVFDSGLPLAQAKKLYSLLHNASAGLSCDTHPLHLLWVLLQSVDSPAQIGSWPAYVKLIQMETFLPEQIRKFADLVQLLPTDARQREKLLRPDKPPSKDVRVQHGTFLIAICLSQILNEEADPQQTVARWTCVPRTGQSLTSQPVSGRALLKLLKDDVAQQAAMAALLCESAGWTQLSALLSLLSADAAAGSRPELRELLRVEGLDARRARALFNAGLKAPLAVLQADSTSLKEALIKALPVTMQRHPGPHVKGGTLAAAQIGLGTDIGANQLLLRSVDSVRSMVEKHFHAMFMERELEISAAEMDAADLSASYSSYHSQQPLPTQLSSQMLESENTALSHGFPISRAAVASNMPRSLASQNGHQSLIQPSLAGQSQHVPGGVLAGRVPLVRTSQLYVPSALSQGPRPCCQASQMRSAHSSNTRSVPLAGPTFSPDPAEHQRIPELEHMRASKVPRRVSAIAGGGSQSQAQTHNWQVPASHFPACWANGFSGRSQTQSAPSTPLQPSTHRGALPLQQNSAFAGSAMLAGTARTAHASDTSRPNLSTRHA